MSTEPKSEAAIFQEKLRALKETKAPFDEYYKLAMSIYQMEKDARAVATYDLLLQFKKRVFNETKEYLKK